MKTLKIGTIGILFFALVFSLNTFAQRGYGQGNGQGYGNDYTNDYRNDQGYFCNNLPDLTDEQQTKITEFRTKHLKQMQDDRNQLALKRASLQVMRTAESVDMSAINKIIDEMGVIQTRKHKNREQHFQDVRNLLTDNQKIYFDSFNRGNGNRGFGQGRGSGRGQGKGSGRHGGW